MAEADGRLNAAVLIPAYNPDEKLLRLLHELKGRFRRIVLVDDGSTKGREIFPQAGPLVEKILVHPVNRGKGAALRTGFAYLGDVDVVTADADGQHRPADIARVAEALATHRRGLVLGVRAFTGKVPLRSRFGNWCTRWFFFLMTRLMISDTQTGLRGIPAGLVKRMLAIKGDRYEYEMAMLADARSHEERPLQIPIETVYIADNATSHFNPVRDAIRIYRSLVLFCISSVLSFLLDNAIFSAAIWMMAPRATVRRFDILVAFLIARLVSANFNYLYNRFVVFPRKGRRHRIHRSYYGYAGLVVAVMTAGYLCTSAAAWALDAHGVAITVVKIVVEAVLFVASYLVQKKFIFKAR